MIGQDELGFERRIFVQDKAGTNSVHKVSRAKLIHLVHAQKELHDSHTFAKNRLEYSKFMEREL